MEKIFQLIGEVGLPIAGALAMGAIIFINIKQMELAKYQKNLFGEWQTV